MGREPKVFEVARALDEAPDPEFLATGFGSGSVVSRSGFEIISEMNIDDLVRQGGRRRKRWEMMLTAARENWVSIPRSRLEDFANSHDASGESEKATQIRRFLSWSSETNLFKRERVAKLLKAMESR
jgi:hypothetical protein